MDQRRSIEAPALVLGHRADLIHPFSDAEALVRQIPDARLVQARSIVELRFRPERLLAEIDRFLHEAWDGRTGPVALVKGRAAVTGAGDRPLRSALAPALQVPPVRVPPAPWRSLGPLARLAGLVTARAAGGEPLRVITTLGRHPRLFRAWLRFGAGLLLRGDLPPADRELVTLRTAWRCGSWYEWAQHVALAARAGLDPGDVARVVEGAAAGRWQPRQRLLIQAADELHDHRVIGDRTWHALAAELTDRQLIELCLIVGHYEMLAMTLNSLGVEPEPSALAALHGDAARAASRLRERLLDARE